MRRLWKYYSAKLGTLLASRWSLSYWATRQEIWRAMHHGSSFGCSSGNSSMVASPLKKVEEHNHGYYWRPALGEHCLESLIRLQNLLLWFEPVPEFCQCEEAMRQSVLLCFVHFSVRFPHVFENRIPALNVSTCRDGESLWNHTPKSSGPRGGTIFPCLQSVGPPANSQQCAQPTVTLPSKMRGLWPEPSQYANVQTAWALLSS